MINFIAGGLMGDFIHSLYVVKHICLQQNKKANVFIAEGYGDVWKFSLEKTHDDLKELMLNQSYIEQFKILDTKNPPKDFIDLTEWRKHLVKKNGVYVYGWTDVLSKCYKFTPSENYAWLKSISHNPTTKDKILIHRSIHRHNGQFPWKEILNNIKNQEVLFLMVSDIEWQKFPYKYDNVKPLHMPTVSEIANSIAGCKMFIGNQSSPFSIACGLDVPRLVELDADPAAFYMNEIKYTNKISWFLNNENKFNAPNSTLNI